MIIGKAFDGLVVWETIDLRISLRCGVLDCWSRRRIYASFLMDYLSVIRRRSVLLYPEIIAANLAAVDG